MTWAACSVNTTVGDGDGPFRLNCNRVSCNKDGYGGLRSRQLRFFYLQPVQYIGELGAEVEVRRNDQVTVAEVEAMRPERIVISPGPCTPQDAGISIDLIRHFAGKVPILGVCLGHQAIGAAFGGSVIRAPHLMHGKTSAVTHDNKSIFRGLPMPMTATRYHSLIVEEKNLPAELEVSAWTTEKDGSRTIMGLRHRKFAVEGVQFHPESVLTDAGKKLVGNFLAVVSGQ